MDENPYEPPKEESPAYLDQRISTGGIWAGGIVVLLYLLGALAYNILKMVFP
jgi:hypothetical protein